ncbi:MAG: GNAT family protein [Cyanobacteria bacterium P01_G01_bin.54]
MPLPTLKTQRLVLRPFTLADAPTVQKLGSAYDVASKTLSMPHPYPDGMAEAWIAPHEPDWDNKTWITLALTLKKDDTEPQEIMGAVSLKLCLIHQRAGLAYWLGMPYWNQGYMTEAAYALVKYGFEELNLNRIEAGHHRSNPASGRVMQKIGMQHEGINRQYILRFGKFEDRVMYGLLASDWKKKESQT